MQALCFTRLFSVFPLVLFCRWFL